MNKFTAVLLSACLLSESASWSMCKAVEYLLDKNCARVPKVALLICAPLAYGCFDCIRTLKKSAETRKLIEKIAGKNEKQHEVAQKFIADLKMQENIIKRSCIALSCTFVFLTPFISNTILNGDLIMTIGISTCISVFNISLYIDDLKHDIGMCNSELLDN